jgi:hypothetical protein
MLSARLLRFSILFAIVSLFARRSAAQDNSNWTSTSQSRDPSGNTNPLRTRETHTESNGRIVDHKIIETLGPDGEYVPYLETETESVRVDANTVRTTERTFGTGPDGGRALVQQVQQESRALPNGESNTVRTTSNPDANGTLQIVQREQQHTRQIAADVQETKTTLLTPSANGGLAPAMQIEERQQKNADGTVKFRKSTSLPDGAGNWQVGEVREGTRRQDGNKPTPQTQNLEERVLRPDSSGALTTVERTVTRQTANGSGDQRETRETYSTYSPGTAGDNGLQLVQRETMTSRTTSAGDRTTTRQVERPTPGSSSDGLHLTDQAIDIVRPGADGTATQQSTVVTFDSAGHSNTVWVDTGKTDNPAVVHVDTSSSAKPK